MEQWREVPGTDGMYEVSDRGRVRSWSSMKRGAEVAQFQTKGLMRVMLRVGKGRDRKMTPFAVARLVAEAFLGARPEGAKVRHLNGNKADNRVENLAYGSAGECLRDAALTRAVEATVRDLVRDAVRKELHRQPICPNGHPLTTANLYEHEGETKCRACALEEVARYRRERRTTPVAALAR